MFPIYIINNYIEGNKSGVAILNYNTFGICRTQEIQKKCGGKHCDCQRPNEMLNQRCGFWGTSSIRITNLALLYNVVVDYRTSSFMMRIFFSNRLNLDIQVKSFPQTVPITALDHTDSSDNLEDVIENFADFINGLGGFTVVMWYSRDKINGKSLISM